MSPRSLLVPTDVPASRSGAAILAKGFRPFFLGASLFATSAVVAWVAMLEGRLATPAYFVGAGWHAHEMVFGFAVAVVGGFLLTAVGNWTGRETAIGAALAALAGLWAAGRVAIACAAALPRGAAALVDVSFLPVLAVVCARPIVATRNHRNLGFLAMLAALAAANAMTHAAALGLAAQAWRSRGPLVGVDLLVVMTTVMTGRIVPSFTRNATKVESIAGRPALDRLATSLAVAVALGDALAAPGAARAAFAIATAGALVARSTGWGARHVARHPLLWVLHAGHAWLAVGLALRAAAVFVPSLPDTAGLHALTVGGVGMLTLGMMARVGLGHTGRPLVTAWPLSVAFGALAASALVRVAGPLVAPAHAIETFALAGVLFVAAFSTYAASHARLLATPRVDGRPG